MDHSLFFREWTWDGRGKYIDDKGQIMPFEGTARTFHEEGLWLHEGKMTLTPVEGPPLSIVNRQEVLPFEKETMITEWTTRNPHLGILTGHLVIVNEAILSLCRSENGLFTGCETFLRIDDEMYGSWGTLFRQGERISSWTLRFRKKAQVDKPNE